MSKRAKKKINELTAKLNGHTHIIQGCIKLFNQASDAYNQRYQEAAKYLQDHLDESNNKRGTESDDGN